MYTATCDDTKEKILQHFENEPSDNHDCNTSKHHDREKEVPHSWITPIPSGKSQFVRDLTDLGVTTRE
jgi:hypothetical protein